MPRAGPRRCAARTSSWRRRATCASRAARAERHVVLRMENRIVNLGAGPAELFGRRVSLTEMRAPQVVVDAAGRRRRIVDRGRAVLQVGALARRVLLEVPERGALRAVGHRCRPGIAPGWCAPGPSTTTACATSTACATAPTVRRKPLLRRVQPARGHPRGHPRDVGGLGRRLSLDLSRQLDRGHGPERLLRGRAPRRPGQRDLASPTRPTTSARRSCGCPTSPGRSAAPKVQPGAARSARAHAGSRASDAATDADGPRAGRQDRLRHGRDARDRPGDRPAPGRRGLRRGAVRARRR